MKKLLLFFGLFCMINLTFAQQTVILNGHGNHDGAVRDGDDPVDASLPFSDILFWVGSGSDSAEFIVNFAQPDTAFAWGFLFNGSTTAQEMVNAIAAADPRFWSEGSPSSGGDLHFVLSNGDTLGLSPVDPTMGYNFWWTNLNGVSAGAGAASTLHNGDIFKYGDMNSAIGWDFQYGYYMEEAWVKTPTAVAPPTDPLPDEATIAFSEILYWVGEGSNEAVMAVNWADTALAWGYRWNGTATVADMMADIAAADPRFSYELGSWGLDDIIFAVAEGDTLRKVPYSYWESKNNGYTDMGMGQTLANGDFEKWAEPAAGIIADSMEYDGYWYYTYVYPMTINPVSVPETGSGIDNHEISRMYAYPNPCTNTLYITNENAERIELYNANGKLLEAVENHDTQVTLNMQQYPAGLYLLKVGNDVQKILKK